MHNRRTQNGDFFQQPGNRFLTHFSGHLAPEKNTLPTDSLLDMRVKAIVTDDVIASVLDTIPDIICYTKCSLGMLSFVDSKRNLIEKWYQRACEFVKSIRVASISDEETCLKGLTTIWRQLEMFDQFTEQEQQNIT